MNDAHGALKLRTADASPVLDFVRPPARSSRRLPLMLLTLLVAGGLALQGGRLWAPAQVAAVMPEKSMKILPPAEDSNKLPAPAEDSDRLALAAVDQALAERPEKPAVTAVLPARAKARTGLESPLARHRPMRHPPSRVMTASAGKPLDRADPEALPESTIKREPEPAMAMHEVTLRNHVRLTNGALD